MVSKGKAAWNIKVRGTEARSYRALESMIGILFSVHMNSFKGDKNVPYISPRTKGMKQEVLLQCKGQTG